MNWTLGTTQRQATGVKSRHRAASGSRKISFLRRTMVTLAALALALPAPSLTPPAHAQNLPNLGDESAAVLTPQMERKIGEGFYRELRRDPSFLDDAEVTAYLQELGARLLAAGPEPAMSVEFFVIKDRQINAFAMLGGYIGVNSGLITASESESETASVLGHEIGHLTQKHIARGFAAGKRSSMVSLVASALCLLAARSNPQVASGCLVASQAGAVQSQLAFSREFEREADRIGFDILDKGGFDVAAMPVFFERLQRSTRILESNAPSYVRSHPLTTERIADTRNRVQRGEFAAGQSSERGGRSTGYRAQAESLTFHLVRAKLRAGADDSIDGTRDVIKHFTTLIESRAGVYEAANYLGLAYAHLQAKNPAAARAAFARIANSAAHPMYAALDARIRRAAGDAAGALAVLRNALNRHSSSRALQLEVIESLQEAGRHAEALALLTGQLQLYRSDPKLHELQSKSYAAEGKRMAQYQALGEYFVLLGSLPSAIEQFQLARCTGEADFYQSSILDSRIRTLWQRLLDERAGEEGAGRTPASAESGGAPRRPGVAQGMPTRCQ